MLLSLRHLLASLFLGFISLMNGSQGPVGPVSDLCWGMVSPTIGNIDQPPVQNTLVAGTDFSRIDGFSRPGSTFQEAQLPSAIRAMKGAPLMAVPSGYRGKRENGCLPSCRDIFTTMRHPHEPQYFASPTKQLNFDAERGFDRVLEIRSNRASIHGCCLSDTAGNRGTPQTFTYGISKGMPHQCDPTLLAQDPASWDKSCKRITFRATDNHSEEIFSVRHITLASQGSRQWAHRTHANSVSIKDTFATSKSTFDNGVTGTGPSLERQISSGRDDGASLYRIRDGSDVVTSGLEDSRGTTAIPESAGQATEDLQANTISLPLTTQTSGIIYQNGIPFIHAYGDPNTDGHNTFVGLYAGNFTLSAVGGFSNLASSNTGVGQYALHSLTTGHLNVAIGDYALSSVTSGVSNTALGHGALALDTTGGNNTAVGGGALQYNTTGYKNNAIGIDSLVYNTEGSYNTAIGTSALRSNSTGSNNIAIGDQALYENRVGEWNVSIGNASLSSNTEGRANMAAGSYSMNMNSTGSFNTALGSGSLENGTTGVGNTGVGFLSLIDNSSGNYNTGIGYLALSGNSTGFENVGIGLLAGYSEGVPLMGNSSSVFIGARAGTLEDGLTNVVVIGAGAQGTRSNQVVLGNSEVSETLLEGNIGIGTENPTHTLSFDGTRSASIGVERNIASNSGGRDLTIQSGGASDSAVDKNAGNLILAPGVSTGGGSGSIRYQRLSRAVVSTANDNEVSDAIVIPSEFNLINHERNALFEVAIPRLTGAGGWITYTVVASDGTDVQSLSGTVGFDAINNGVGYKGTIGDTPNVGGAACSAGTLSATWLISTEAEVLSVIVIPESSLTATSFKLRYVLHYGGSQTVILR